MTFFDYFRTPELRLGGLLIPWVALILCAGFLAAWAVSVLMERTGWSRRVWHYPLFFTALVLLFSSLIGLLLAP